MKHMTSKIKNKKFKHSDGQIRNHIKNKFELVSKQKQLHIFNLNILWNFIIEKKELYFFFQSCKYRTGDINMADKCLRSDTNKQ